MSLSFLFLILLGYILYRFIVGFVLPVARTTRTMKKQFEQMKQQQSSYAADEPANSGTRQQATSSNDDNNQQRTTSGRKGAKEDYIDFEEIPASKY